MKRLNWKVVLAALCMVVFFSACDNDDDKNNEQALLQGTWIVESFPTDNDALNALCVMVPSLINMEQTTFTYTADGKLNIHLVPANGEASDHVGSYTYGDKKLTLKIDVYPLTLEVVSITDKAMKLETTISPQMLGILIQVIQEAYPDFAGMLDGLIGDSLEKGLKITINQVKK
ncbi:hypothetical protein [Parabacteroides sp. PFB2-10]|uniref:hypothetical protein n=1 Tax=Parabacteroides sp. PFB2-10 TaxID=1742405 RepID=UPI00247441BC|nr:hypothetical protein [Parabacteroides sp. PFB2-10]MDL2245122.1 hypothetical protein [Parabacteroides sp. OttesenSCG-928-J18]